MARQKLLSVRYPEIEKLALMLSSISEGVMRLVRAGRMTCKVRRDFKIITDVLSRVSLVTSNIWGSSICSSKSLYKKTSNEILAEFDGICQNGCVKGSEVPTRPTPVCYDLSVRRVSNSQLTPTPCHLQEEGRRRTQLRWTFRVAAIIAE